MTKKDKILLQQFIDNDDTATIDKVGNVYVDNGYVQYWLAPEAYLALKELEVNMEKELEKSLKKTNLTLKQIVNVLLVLGLNAKQRELELLLKPNPDLVSVEQLADETLQTINSVNENMKSLEKQIAELELD